MSNKKKIALAIAVVVIIALMVAAAVTGGALAKVDCPDCDTVGLDCATCGGEGKVIGSWWALVPPVIAIGLALITKEVYSSLLIGIISGALLASNFSFMGTVDSVVETGLIGAVSGTAGIFIFLVELGIIVALVNKAGGSAAFGRWAKDHIKTRAGAMFATFVLGILIFIDDYFNCLTVGSVMRPITDRHNVSRAKLSYLIDATAAPVCMIAPISSWAAAVAQYADDGEGLKLFVMAIPYNFYSLLTLVFIVVITLMKFDFGPMRRFEKNAVENGDLFTTGVRDSCADDENANPKGRVIDIIIPIVILIAVCVFALVYNGGILDGVGFIDAFSNTDATVGLPWGGLIALILIIVYLIIRRVVDFEGAMKAVPQGFIAMVPAILILTFATALKEMTGLLGAKYYVHELMNGAAAGLSNFLPAIIFIVACILAFATGTSWGTFGILIPIITHMFNSGDPMFIIGISACLAGAVCGDHCSPISDTTIMASAGADCNHVDHVSTQLPYAIFVAVISFICYICSAVIHFENPAVNAAVLIGIGTVLVIGGLFAMKAILQKKNNN